MAIRRVCVTTEMYGEGVKNKANYILLKMCYYLSRYLNFCIFKVRFDTEF